MCSSEGKKCEVRKVDGAEGGKEMVTDRKRGQNV